jgi:hypothetical protein
MHAPNLRGAAVAEILTALIDGCQQMGGHGGGCQVQPDEGRDLGWSSLSAASVPDRKARVHVVAYLNGGS